MSYENRVPPEGINVSPDHPLKEFAWLLAGVSLGGVILFAIMYFAAGFFVRFIPFDVEKKLVEKHVYQYPSVFGQRATSVSDKKTERYLQQLADQLALHQQLPDDMHITVHYLEDESVNAFATLGGHVFIFSGLYKKMPSENALSMVLAHEIAHIKHRDPIVAAGRGITMALAFMVFAGLTDTQLAEGLLGQTNIMTALAFNRAQENDADKEALKTLISHYGHVHGAAALFEQLEASAHFNPPALLSTHPLHQERIDRIREWQTVAAEDIVLRPIPVFHE